MNDDTKKDLKYKGKELQDPEQVEKRKAAIEEDGTNSPDQILSEDTDQLDQNQRVSADVGENLTTQHPTQSQTSGQSAVGGADDVDYGREEETTIDDAERGAK